MFFCLFYESNSVHILSFAEPSNTYLFWKSGIYPSQGMHAENLILLIYILTRVLLQPEQPMTSDHTY